MKKDLAYTVALVVILTADVIFDLALVDRYRRFQTTDLEEDMFRDSDYYAIFDIKADRYLTPFPETNNATALRQFEAIVNNPESFVYTHPEDYQLFRVGSWDHIQGDMEGVTKMHLADATDFSRARETHTHGNGSDGQVSTVKPQGRDSLSPKEVGGDVPVGSLAP